MHIEISLWPGNKQAELENRAFESLNKHYGDIELERRIQRREITRNYYRKLTREGWQTKVGLEDIDLTTGENVLEEIAGKEFTRDFKNTLSPLELSIVAYLEQGYKPLEISRFLGRKTSNAVRWHKHHIKQKLRLFMLSRPQ